MMPPALPSTDVGRRAPSTAEMSLNVALSLRSPLVRPSCVVRRLKSLELAQPDAEPGRCAQQDD